jgi:hypothetical protein
MMSSKLSRLSAKLAVQSVATTIIIGKAVASAGSSFIADVKDEVVSRQSEPKQLELDLDNPNERVEKA